MSVLPCLTHFKSITLKHNFRTIKCTHFKCTVEGIWAVVYICVTSTPVESRSPVASPPTPRHQSLLSPFLAQAFHHSFKRYDPTGCLCDNFCYNTVNFMFITSLDLTPPYSCLFSCSSPAEIWLKNIYIVHHPRNAEEKRNLKHGSFVCLTKPPL